MEMVLTSNPVPRGHTRAKCVDCGGEKLMLNGNYQAALRRRGTYRCHPCAISQPQYLEKQAQAQSARTRKHPKSLTGLKIGSPELKEHLSKKSKAVFADPEARRLSSERSKKSSTPEVRQAISRSVRMIMCTPEYLEGASKRSKANYQNPEYREKLRVVMNSPEFKEKVSITSIRAWEKTEYREKQEAADLEHAALASRTSIAMWADPAHREKVEAIMKSPEHRKKVSDASRKLWERPEYREKMAIVRANQPRVSGLQTALYAMLDTMSVTYEPEGTATAIGYYAFDCLIPKTGEMKKHLLIECQGDYWHSLDKTVRNDKAKFTYIERYFPDYEIMYVWEHEFYTDGRVLDRLKLKLGIGVETKDFNFKDIRVTGSVPSKELKSFLDAYHYIGGGRSGKVFGAYHGETLVAACVFSPPLRNNMAYGEFLELSRLCIHPSYHKKNFASWFVSRCLRAITCTVVSYCDTTVGHQGTVYKAANFRFSHEVAPDYWWVGDGGFVMHKLTMYKKAKGLKMTENTFAEQRGYRKQWGGKKLCYIYG